MKIVHVCLDGTYNDNWGYQENILPICNRKIGNEVTVIASNYIDNDYLAKVKIKPCEYESAEGIVIRRIRYWRKVPYFFADKLKLYEGLYGVLEEENPDIILHHGAIGFTLRTIVKYKKRHKKCTCYIDSHSDQFNCARNFGAKILHRVLWRIIMTSTVPYIETYFGVLPIRCDFLNKTYGIPKNKIDLLIMGVDDDKVISIDKKKSRKEIREEYKIQEKDFLIVTGGKIDSRKNIHLLMKAVNQIPYPDLKLLVFGNVTSEMDGLIKENISERVSYIGWVDADFVYKLFFAADLVVFPGTHSVLWEQACASGVPGIFNKMTGIQHVNVNGNAMFLSNPTVESLVTSIKRLYKDQDYVYTNMKMNAQNAYEKFLYSNIQKKLFEKN